jgi:hypothetical protein
MKRAMVLVIAVLGVGLLAFACGDDASESAGGDTDTDTDSSTEDPCEGVVCDDIPEDECQGDSLLQYSGEAMCVDGECIYSYVVTDCDEGCAELDGHDECWTLCTDVECPADYSACEDLYELAHHSFECNEGTGECDDTITSEYCYCAEDVCYEPPPCPESCTLQEDCTAGTWYPAGDHDCELQPDMGCCELGPFLGTLAGQIDSAGVTVYVIVSTDLSIWVAITWSATGGNVNNVALSEVRVLLDDTEFWAGESADFDVTSAEFDGIVQEDTQVSVAYEYQNTTQEGFHEHCNELLTFEIDATYNEGTALDTMTYSGDSVLVVCLSE